MDEFDASLAALHRPSQQLHLRRPVSTAGASCQSRRSPARGDARILVHRPTRMEEITPLF